jgi:hypothetical protein
MVRSALKYLKVKSRQGRDSLSGWAKPSIFRLRAAEDKRIPCSALVNGTKITETPDGSYYQDGV